MLLAKTVGLLAILSVVGGDMITFKPFIKSRYSLRDRSKTTTRVPLWKLNGTAVISIHEADTSQRPSQSLETTVISDMRPKKVLGTKGPQHHNAVPATGDGKTKQKEKNPETTTQTDWFYDYFAGEEENARHI